jgi:signal transduction histidine kinase
VETRKPPFTWRLTFRYLLIIDAVVAVVAALGLAYFLEVKGGACPAVPPWLGVALVCVAAGGIAVRRLRPHTTLAMATGASATLAVLGFGVGNQMFVAALPVYIVALVKPARPAMLALAGVVATLLVLVAIAPAAPLTSPRANRIESNLIHSMLPAVVIIATWAVGRAISSVRAANERQAQMTVQTERLRIARELHDVVAHSMSVIAVQAGVGRYVIHQQPLEAEKSLVAIETTSRAALTEMRRLMGVLREEKPGDLFPAPGIADLPELTEQTRRGGLTVDLTVKDVPDDLPVGVDLTVFRIVQEALTNVIKHAGTDRSSVKITYVGNELRIEITDEGNGPTGAPGGHGLVGMRERAALYGGQLEAGPLPHRGFKVVARLPA